MKADGGGIGAGDRDRPGDRAPGAVTDASGPEAGTPVLAARHVEAIMAAAEEAHSPATRRAYKASWRVFRVWVRGQGLDALPAAPETVAAYLAERAGAGVSRSTMAMARAAIRYHHETSGLANPCDSPGVRRVLRGLNRRAAAEGPRARQAAGLTAVGFAAIRATARLPRIGRGGHRESEEEAAKRGAVDIALAAVMRDALLRRAEAAALRWGDVEFRSDGSARVTIRRSKNDQDGRGIIQFVGPPAAEALGAIRPGEVSAEARVFGLRTGHSISNRLAAMAKAGGPRRRLQRPLAPCRHGPGSRRGLHRASRPHGRRPLEVGTHARPLCERRVRRTRRGGPVLRYGGKRSGARATRQDGDIRGNVEFSFEHRPTTPPPKLPLPPAYVRARALARPLFPLRGL